MITKKYMAMTPLTDKDRNDTVFVIRFNPHRAGTELTRFNKVNIMAADALAPYVARTSAALILIM